MTKTNDEIFDKIVDVEKHVLKTNGKVIVNRWIATSALSLSTFIAGLLLISKL